MTKKEKILLADDATESVGLLLRIRLPWLILGLGLSLGTAALVASFEDILSLDPRIAFFIPLIVYVSDSVGTQTTTIYIRNMGKKRTTFGRYLRKELVLGALIGLIFGLVVGTVSWLWLKSADVAVAVGIALWASVATASVFSLTIATIMKNMRVDPAIGADPIVTVLQDTVSLVIYFVVVSYIIH